MTKKQMTEIFSLWSLNWPAAELFQGGAELIEARIKLYAHNFEDVDYCFGLKGAEISLKERRFPPSIAEYRADINKVINDIYSVSAQGIPINTNRKINDIAD